MGNANNFYKYILYSANVVCAVNGYYQFRNALRDLYKLAYLLTGTGGSLYRIMYRHNIYR